MPKVNDFMKFNVDLSNKTSIIDAHVVLPAHTHISKSKKNLPMLSVDITNIDKTSSSINTY